MHDTPAHARTARQHACTHGTRRPTHARTPAHGGTHGTPAHGGQHGHHGSIDTHARLVQQAGNAAKLPRNAAMVALAGAPPAAALAQQPENDAAVA